MPVVPSVNDVWEVLEFLGEEYERSVLSISPLAFRNARCSSTALSWQTRTPASEDLSGIPACERIANGEPEQRGKAAGGDKELDPGHHDNARAFDALLVEREEIDAKVRRIEVNRPACKRRRAESEEEKVKRLGRASERWAEETPEERAARLVRRKAARQNRLAKQTPEQKYAGFGHDQRNAQETS
ncbi:hypothetical protein PPTG_15415 [Phytophthora nicotianae INRA-310]|uniref:Uncharacterized protein n=1 Tax=Phytophthora nicotianae (strain INRA-310) TaxID=761204 RepID=W2PVK8_PHYN3|nr:hypothetical protein PPTG_15415 [Phytophthora nicotianae INRA-310]ETN04060.1 hypothetical protein PPTG_15415 [Phytophthora nicotianae INRA-310]